MRIPTWRWACIELVVAVGQPAFHGYRVAMYMQKPYRLLITVEDMGIGISKILEPLKSSSPEQFTDLSVLPLQENQLKLFKGTIQFQPGVFAEAQEGARSWTRPFQ